MPRYKALTDVVVAGKPAAAGKIFEAPEPAVRDAVAAGLVEKAPPKDGRRKR